jgi:hypothetical protein
MSGMFYLPGICSGLFYFLFSIYSATNLFIAPLPMFVHGSLRTRLALQMYQSTAPLA